MTHVLAVDTSKIIHDSAIIKENTMKIVEQLAKQDKILEQIAWDRAVLSQRSETTQGKLIIMKKYFESLTEYAGSVWEDSVSENVAEEMSVQSTDCSSSSTAITNTLEPSPIMSEETANLVTLVIGNTHRLVTLVAGSLNKHLWTFYLLASGPEIIEEVKIYIVSSFRANLNLHIIEEVLINASTLSIRLSRHHLLYLEALPTRSPALAGVISQFESKSS
jgi:hypothetical protein